MTISGDNFHNLNEGTFKVFSVKDDEIWIKNDSAKKEENTLVPFNQMGIMASWFSGHDYVTGVAGCFKYINTGDYVKKVKDGDEYFTRIISCEGGDYTTTTKIYLASLYLGSSESAYGHAYNQMTGHGTGVELLDREVFQVYDSESLKVGDELNIPNLLENTWFSNYNTGIFAVKSFGTNANYEQYLVLENSNAVNETITLSSNYNQIKFTENPSEPYSTTRILFSNYVNADNNYYRTLYFYPSDKLYKMDRIYGTKVRSLQKLDFDTDTSAGIDGYNYYTGLLQQVQRTIYGFDKDNYNYPGYKAIGTKIEILSPLIKKVTLYLEVVTKDGINLKDISENIKSIVINYINNLKIGESVILSEVIARVMSVKGVKSVSLSYPNIDEKEIPISHTEKAYTDSTNIVIN
jgi:hypothetical protein